MARALTVLEVTSRGKASRIEQNVVVPMQPRHRDGNESQACAAGKKSKCAAEALCVQAIQKRNRTAAS
jgi:hypothetical protein